ncbi:MAG: sensor histidine kinase, partial [Pirellulales bacterium]
VACRQLDIVEEEVRGLLALGRPPETAPAPVDLDALIAEVRDLVGPRCDHAGVALAAGPPCGSQILGSRDGLRAAVVNLALNAIDAAGNGGEVTVAVEDDAAGVALVVEDDGPGPPAELADSLHEPFVTGKQEGVGLGLAVARAVAEQHGGALAWRRVGGRTRFEIRLPATAALPREPVA